MHRGTPFDGSASVHWLEHLSENLEHLPAAARGTAYSLLRSPWKCSRDDVLEHVPSPLADSIVFLQKSVLRHVFRQRPRLRLGTAALDLGIGAFAQGPNGSLEPMGPNTGIAVEVFLGLAKEDLAREGIRWSELSGPARASLLALYAKCEVAVHLMAGMFEAASNADRTMHYVIPAPLHAARKIRWFSLYWAQQSNIADTDYAMVVLHGLHQLDGPARGAEFFQDWVDYILDKFLCLHRRYIPKLLQTGSGTAVSKLWARAELLCFIWVHHLAALRDVGDFLETVLEDRPLASISREHLRRAGFGDAEVDALLAESAAQPPGDQLITQADDPLQLHVHNLNLKFAVQRYVRPQLNEIGSTIGHWFERDYLLQYIQDRLDSSRFIAWPEFNDKDAKYDADIIIYDKATRLFYFCQVKHRAQVLQPYLRDELDEFARGKSINHGLGQLSRLRDLIDSEQVRKRLISKLGKKLVGTGPLSERSRFLLVHTVENFDMCTRRGIIMYEWNTFRNLLQGHMLFVRHDLDGTMQYETEELDFSDLVAVQKHLMEVTAHLSKDMAPHQLTPEGTYAVLQHAELSLQYRKALWLNDKSIGKLKARILRAPLL
ncbi:hypothetical protein [Ralstonia solanacearum]|uniref:hypothetical protein n=1 Tax=Ralstonia solanacearum TaxID=305 RepID=UPI0018667B00|nr:hypothetical protein [Ralstonia solanacearum]QOK80725.1 hypothetical protein HF906_00175 [Ralstonia solanacearum]